MSRDPKRLQRGVPELIDPEASNWVDLSDLLEDIEQGASGEGTPPPVTEAGTLLWPQHTVPPSHVLSATIATETHEESWEDFVDELLEQSKHCSDESLRSALLVEAGRTLIERLGRKHEGEQLLQRSDNPIAALLSEDSGRKIASLSSELAALEAAARDTTNATEDRAASWIELGQLCEERTPGLKRALDAYHEALALVPDHPVALTLAADASALLEEESALSDIETKLSHLKTPRLRLAGLLDLSELVTDPDQRRKILEQAHQADPAEETALRRLIRACDDDPHQLGELYRELARIASDNISRSTALHLAFLTLAETGRPVDELVKELAGPTTEAEDDKDILAPLSEVALHVEQRISTGEQAEGLPDNISILERLWHCLDDPREQALVREQSARLRLEQLKADLERASAERADTALAEALEGDLRFCLVHLPEHRWVSEALAELLELRGDLPGLVLHLQEWSRKQSAGPGRAEILLRLGEVHERLRKDLPRAAEVYELAVAEDPDNPSCLRALGRAYEKMRRWPQAIASLQRQAQETDDASERLAALRRVAVMAEHELHDVDLAIATLEEVARMDADDLLSLYQLAALCRTHGRPAVLLNTLQMLIERLDDDIARTAILVELGEVQELHLKQRAAARESYERALSLQPGYTPALRALARLYRDNGDLEALLGLLTIETDPITDPALLALKAGRVAFEEMGDLDRAIEFLQGAYQTNPDLGPARELLMQLLTASGRISEAYDLLRAQDPPQTDPLLADYHYRLGLLVEALGRSDAGESALARENAALQHYRAAILTQPDHGLAVERSRRILVARHDLDNLIRLLEQQVEHIGDEMRPVLSVQLARLYVSRGDDETARTTYEQAYQAAGGDPLIRREFEVLLRQMDGHRTLPALYLTAARNSPDTHYKATLFVEAAELLLKTNLDEDRDLASKAILLALRDDPGNPYAVRHLERLLTEPGFSVSVRDAVGARAVRAQSDAERALFYLESAELLERADSTDQARRAYLAAEDALPGLQPVQLALDRIASGRQRVAATQESRTSVHVLMAEARDAAARSASGDSEASTQALNRIREILTRDPEHRDAAALARALAGQLPDASAVVELLTTVFESTKTLDLRHELGLFLGENAGHLEQAIHYFSAAAEARPDDKQALRGLVNTYRQMGDDRKAAEATERLLELFDPGEPSAIDLRMGIASFLGAEPETLPRALEHAKIVLQTRNDDPRALTLMVELLERSGEPVQAADLLERMIGRERNRERLHDLQLRKARLLAEVPGKEAPALEAVERAAAIDAGDRDTIALLVDLLDRSGQTERIATYLQPMRNALQSNITRGAISLRDLGLLARVAEATHPELAATARQLLHAIEPSSPEPPAEPGKTATSEGLRKILDTPSLRSALCAAREPPHLQELLGAVDGVLHRLRAEFSVLDPHDAVPIPASADPKQFAAVFQQWSGLFDVPKVEFGACSTHNAAILLHEGGDVLRLGSNLWMQGDEIGWRGLAAVALARRGFAAAKARALPPIELDLLLAACFELVEVFNAITADPEPRRLRDLTSQLGKVLPRRQRKRVEQHCQSMSGEDFAPSETARATLASDLRLAAVFSGDPAACLSAASLLDGVAGGSLKYRVSRSAAAQELLGFLLSDDYITLRATATKP